VSVCAFASPISTPLSSAIARSAPKGIIHLIVPPERFELLSGKDDLTTYTFNTGVAKHTFCKHCGIHPFMCHAQIRTRSTSTRAASMVLISRR
jgi:hypothetical protein